MDRALRANVITKSGKAVETAGDIDTLLLDKTGTITIGNRKATEFYPVAGMDKHAFIEACLMSSVSMIRRKVSQSLNWDVKWAYVCVP